MRQNYSIAIVGAGVGGLAAGIALRKLGYEVTVLERVARIGRIGADVNLTPNATKALLGLGIRSDIRKFSAQPTHRISRMWDTGEETSRLEMGDSAERKYKSPQLTIHRADLIDALRAQLPSSAIELDRKVEEVAESDEGVSVTLDGGEERAFDALIGADGIHSVVREQLFGSDNPEFTGVVSYRAVVPRDALSIPNLDAFTKWWGPDPALQIVTFPLNQGQEQFVFATAPQNDWREESWTLPGDVDELKAIYRDFHPEARALLAACPGVTKSALYVREPLPVWSRGRVTLLGDACHPMMPFMAQGAGMAIEDAVVLSRALEKSVHGDFESAFKIYETPRKERTAQIQKASRGNEWLKNGDNADWVYGYDAWTTLLSDSHRESA